MKNGINVFIIEPVFDDLFPRSVDDAQHFFRIRGRDSLKTDCEGSVFAVVVEAGVGREVGAQIGAKQRLIEGRSLSFDEQLGDEGKKEDFEVVQD